MYVQKDNDNLRPFHARFSFPLAKCTVNSEGLHSRPRPTMIDIPETIKHGITLNQI